MIWQYIAKKLATIAFGSSQPFLLGSSNQPRIEPITGEESGVCCELHWLCMHANHGAAECACSGIDFYSPPNRRGCGVRPSALKGAFVRAHLGGVLPKGGQSRFGLATTLHQDFRLSVTCHHVGCSDGRHGDRGGA